MNIPRAQAYRYALILLSAALFLAPFSLIPSLFGNSDLCGPLCMRRFYLIHPGLSWQDVQQQLQIMAIGASFLGLILVSTFFFGRLWCAYLCPMGGLPELASRLTGERWKLEYRWLPQVPIRYGYFIVFILVLPWLGVSACHLCNFITVPRIFQSLSGDWRGWAYLASSIGTFNLALVIVLGLLANKGRAYCAFLCPIGALDGLVNHMGAHFRFTRRIRVERNRCTGCNECARRCMCGAITMVNRVAVVDQLSCMSCHECADVCDWGAIDWLSVPPELQPKRKKKNIEFHPLPQWKALHQPRQLSKLRLLFLLILLFILLLWRQSQAAELDPDGCLSCHALPGFEFIDEKGVLRQLRIDVSAYRRSLHGGVACTDCHRQIKRFPHEEDQGVDCSAACHIAEPSQGQAYSHQAIIDEMQSSVHGQGRYRGLTGGNRWQESKQDQAPSCRLCHQNTDYISPQQMPRFQALFKHSDQACGQCHRRAIWRERFTGHVLRRLLGGRWSKAESNALCARCHGDHQRMARVEEATPRFIWAQDSYAFTLHARLIDAGHEQGASCLDCHAPTGGRHLILSADKPQSAVHPERLAQTCSACHAFARSEKAKNFVQTDLHDLDSLPWWQIQFESSPWWGAGAALGGLSGLVVLVALVGSLWSKPPRGKIYAFWGGQRFKRRRLGLKK